MSLRLFVDEALAPDRVIELPAAAARHVQVRRLQPGDALCLFDGRGGEWSAVVEHMGRSAVGVRLRCHDPVDRELPLQVTVALGMPANERMDLLVEKATELGAHAIQPLLCERSVLRLAGERALRKREHWQGIAAAASEQSGRTKLPRIAPVLSLQRWLDDLEDGGVRLLLSSHGDAPPLSGVSLRGAGRVCTLSGPEGGLTVDERSAACARGFRPVRLGPRVLRAETAPLAALAWMALHGA